MEQSQCVIEIYIEVLKGIRQRFPDHFFVGEQGKKYLALITRFLIEEHLNIPVQEIPEKINAKILWSHRLRVPAIKHGWNFIQLIENAYPGQFRPWEFSQVSHGYWQGDEGKQRAIEAVRYVIEEECQISFEDIPQQVNYHFFKKNRLAGVFDVFGQSPYEVINTVYPDHFQPWQFANVPMNYWKDRENIKKTMDWFLFEKLGFDSYGEAIQRLNQKHFFEHRMTGFLQMAFDNRLFKVKQWINQQILESHQQITI
jgi:hypothetical protein